MAQRWVGEVKHLVFLCQHGFGPPLLPKKGVAVTTPSEVVLALGCNLRTYLLVTVAFVAGIFTTLWYFLNLGEEV